MKIVEYGRIVEFEEQKVLLFITRKSANTFIREIVRTPHGKKNPPYLAKYKNWLRGNDVIIDEEIINLWEGHNKYFICRNPYLRLVSYFLDKHRYQEKHRKRGCNDFEGIPIRISFEELVNLLFTNVKRGNFQILEGHRRLQVFLKINQIKFDSIIRIENDLRKQLTQLFRTHNIPEPIIEKLSTTPDIKVGWDRRKANDRRDTAITDTDDSEDDIPLYKMKNFSDLESVNYKDFYNKELMDKVHFVYKEDFDFFGYSYDSL